MDTISLKNQTVDVIECEKCGKKMVNLDADQLAAGDLVTLKQAGVLISNPETENEICVNCEFTPSIGHRLATWFNSPSTSNDDDSDFFHPSSGSFFGSSSSGGFGGSSFGGFSGGGFSGGGASGGF